MASAEWDLGEANVHIVAGDTVPFTVKYGGHPASPTPLPAAMENKTKNVPAKSAGTETQRVAFTCDPRVKSRSTGPKGCGIFHPYLVSSSPHRDKAPLNPPTPTTPTLPRLSFFLRTSPTHVHPFLGTRLLDSQEGTGTFAGPLTHLAQSPGRCSAPGKCMSCPP